jgi:small conductance mechanosensitive channel
VPDLQAIWNELITDQRWVVIVQLVLIVIFTFIALRFAHVTVNAALRRLFERETAEGTAQDLSAVEVERRRLTLDGLAYRALRVVILVIAFLMALRVLSLDIGPAIAGLGIVGLALSLGAQHLVRDYMAGAFVLIENQYSKGDVVAIAGHAGTVEDISLRRTVLRDEDGTVHFVPHGLIQTASNLSRSWAGISLDLPVPYEEDLDAVTDAVNRAGERLAEDPRWRAAVFEPPRVAHVERLAETGIMLNVRGSVAALQRRTIPGALRGLILEEMQQRGLTLGWRPVLDERRAATSAAGPEPPAGSHDPDSAGAASAGGATIGQ